MAPASSPFRRALDEYIKSRPKRSKTPQFILDLQKSGPTLNKDDVQRAMVQLEQSSTDRVTTRNIRKIMKPVIRVLSDYSSIVDSMAQADPMPTALIWGCLKAVMDVSKRFLGLYDTIKDQLENIDTHLSLLTEYEELFGESVTMQELLQASYIDVLRFWRRVEKECSRCVANRIGRSLASFSTSKLDGIVASMEKTAENMSKLVPAVQERLQRGERENQAEERRLAGLARNEQSAFFKIQLEEIKIRNIERKSNRLKDVRTWLCGGSLSLNESNFRHQEQYASQRCPNTCSWLSTDDAFTKWLNVDTSHSNLWLRASPGVGKSVLCAYAIRQVPSLTSSHSAIYHYYTFDEEFSALQVYRSLAEQLVDKVWAHLDDMPEDILAFTQSTSTSSRREIVKTLIQGLLSKLPKCYIFLDGLDEECDDGPRWNELLEVLAFFTKLAREGSPPVRLWCSSQDRACLKAILSQTPVIEVTNDINSDDIELYLSNRIMVLDSMDLDEGYKNLVLKDLRGKADGCFLWASLMLDSVSKAATLSSVQKQINDGLPTDYEVYYQRKIQSIEPSQRNLVSTLLACILYAKRPLRLDELCEAVAVQSASDGQNIEKSQKLFKDRVLKLCEPLVQVQEVEEAHASFSVCSLAHASVGQFLKKNSDILDMQEEQNNRISKDILADVCLRYLSQPCYRRHLTKDGETFRDLEGEDIIDHHLLSYAAKYWDKHLDDVVFSAKLCERVRNFIISPQFYTCLQVQSLFVGGQFSFWYNASNTLAGPHLRRVFPSWLSENCDQTLEKDYVFFVGEWSNLLNKLTSLEGQYAGEIDRCFWAALGPGNFLHKGQSRYKNFMFKENHNDPGVLTSGRYYESRYYDSVDETGSQLLLLKLDNAILEGSELEFCCQKWAINARRPKLEKSHKLKVPLTNFYLYDKPASKKTPGRPSPVSVTRDLKILRIGSQLFSLSLDDIYVPIQLFDDENEYFEEVETRGRYVAVSTRRVISSDDLAVIKNETKEELNYPQQLFLMIEKNFKSLAESAASRSTAPTTNRRNSVVQTSLSGASSSNTSMASLGVSKSNGIDSLPVKPMEDLKSSEESDLSLDEAMYESDGNSAEMSWSDGSTDELSDEVEDEDQWNDWGNEQHFFEELCEDVEAGSQEAHDDAASIAFCSDAEIKSTASDVSDAEVMRLADLDIPHDIQISGAPELLLKWKREQDEEAKESSSDGIESNYSPSFYSTSGDEENDFDHEEAAQLENMIFGEYKAAKSKGAPRVTIRVFEDKGTRQSPVFHFSKIVTATLFSSSPVFHVSKPLLVWPLGGGEVLFANYERNSYFIRQLSCTTYRSCHVFIKAHFSGDGQYLHFAALEARNAEDQLGSPSTEEGKALLLNLQVSTHRLSFRKTARSPPRLLFRTNVSLGRTTSLSVSNLPYTLTWTTKELFFTTRDETLNVIRIPLFRSPNAKQPGICYPQKQIFLPRTVCSRNIHFFPPQPGSKNAGRATVIIGSHSSSPSAGFLVPRNQVSPPIGLFINEEADLGGWKCTSSEDFGQQRQNNAGGRLQGKFERFDTEEDCDIVPYLF